MNTKSSRLLVKVAAIALTGAGSTLSGLVLSGPAQADPIDDALFHQAGEFLLGNGERQIIAQHKTPETYRVCVAKGPDTIPVTARVDGMEQTIGVGSCADVTGKVIELKPATRLQGDEVLVGKFERQH